MAKKKFKSLARLGRLKYWLEFHIFLCTLGPVMILFHTAFKFGGLVSVSFWSMVAVVASGVAGRFIYLQIPRSIEGRALSLHEIQQMKGNLDELLAHQAQMDASNRSLILQTVAAGNVDGKAVSFYQQYLHERQTIRQIRQVLRQNQIDRRLATQILSMVKHEVAINHRIARLQTMQRLFKYWHVAHLPFALVMLVIMIIHVAVTLLLGYRWIF